MNLDKSNDTIERRKEIIESRAGHAELVADELDALGLYLHEEDILTTAIAVDKKILGENHWRMADLNMHLVECYQHLQHTRPIPLLLEEALKINQSKTSPDRGPDSPEALESQLKLGQFLRDQSVFDKAGAMLADSVKRAERIYKSTKDEEIKLTSDLIKAQDGAETAKRIGDDGKATSLNTKVEEDKTELDALKQRIRKSRVLLIEAYNAYADYFSQLYAKDKNKELLQQSNDYFEKGSALCTEAWKELGQ
jgi:hypothetical protein